MAPDTFSRLHPEPSFCPGKLNAKSFGLPRYVVFFRYAQRLSAFMDDLLFRLFQAILNIITKARAVTSK